MNERAALLNAVYTNIHDDLPRMVYADYLMEYGDSRDFAIGEFIAAQLRDPLNCFKYWIRASREYSRLYCAFCVLYDTSPLATTRITNAKIERGFPLSVFVANDNLKFENWANIGTIQAIEYARNLRIPDGIGGFVKQSQSLFTRVKS